MTAVEPTTDVALPVEVIRGMFPALARVHAGLPVAYFDGPGGTQVPASVGAAMLDYLHYHNANTHWVYPSSVETDELLAASRLAVADFLNAAPNEVAFGANMTTLTFHVARALGRGWGAGDEVVVTELDHHANIAPWRALERERGITVRAVRFIRETGQLDWDDFSRALSPRTRLVAVGAASNALGTITDVTRAARAAHDVGALCFVDAVHYAPHELVDVRALGCDFLACSAYKFYGPHVGIMWGRYDVLAELDVPRLDPAPDVPPEHLETGTQNHEGIVGAAAAVDFLAGLAAGGTRRERLRRAFSALVARGRSLTRQLWDGLSAIDGVTLFGPPPGVPRTPTVAFTVAGRSSTEVARRVVDAGIFASNGDFYAATVIERLGLAPDGVVRAGCACYTTADEVRRLVDAVGAIAAA